MYSNTSIYKWLVKYKSTAKASTWLKKIREDDSGLAYNDVFVLGCKGKHGNGNLQLPDFSGQPMRHVCKINNRWWRGTLETAELNLKQRNYYK